MSLIALEFECASHGRFSDTVDRSGPTDMHPCPSCGAVSPWVISAPMGRVKLGEVTRGGSDSPFPGALDTRAIADGMPVEEFRARRAKLHRDARYKQIKAGLA